MNRIYKFLIIFNVLSFLLFVNKTYACSGGTSSGTFNAATSEWQTVPGINGGEYYNMYCYAGEVYIFSFCQDDAFYVDDPQIQIMNSSNNPVTDGYNDDHCGLGSELIWVCPTNGTYHIGFFEYYCQTDGEYLGTVAYKYLPTPTRADCMGARPLCTANNTVNNLESSGSGYYYDLFDYTNNGVAESYNYCPDCLVSGEHFSNWYSFYAEASGSLSFTIIPQVSSQDFDWAVWDMTYMDCNDLIDGNAYGYGTSTWNTYPNPISCNFCGTSGNTGAGSGSLACNGPNSCSNYNSPMTVTAGHRYIMIIDNFDETTDGYSINFSGVNVVDQTPPVLMDTVYSPVCGVNNITVQFSESVSCESMQNSCITISGPNGNFTTTDISSQTCDAAVGNTYSSGTFYDDIWTVDLADYMMEPGNYTITLNPGCATDVCGNGMSSSTSSTLPFTITGISATLNVVAQAGCPGQSVGQLSVTGVSGGCGYGYTYNWSTGSTASSISGLSAGTYSVTVTDGIGRCEWTDDVTIYNAPPINPTASSNSPVCAGSTLNLYGGSSTGTSYSWSGPNGFTSSSEDPSTSAVITGTYTLTATDSWGCTASTSTMVTVYSESWTPTSASADPNTICVGSSTDLTVTPATDPNILDYSTWAVGSGSATGFNQNGSTTENYRINSTDPWGNSTVIWEARPDATSGPDGGWNTPNFAVDNTKTYRYSVWVWRNANGNGSFYLGCHGYGSTNGVYSVSGAGPNLNPYFISSSNVPTAGRWELIVGHVHPYTYSGSTHPESGRYTVSNGKVANISTDYKWLSQTTSGNFRTYLYYCTNTGVRQRWAYPRVDICDGTEPTINELLNGFDPNKTLGTGADWEWYSGSCGGTSVGSGTTITQSPSSNITYYVRAEGTCGNTSCVSTPVTVNTLSTAPTSISGTTLICSSGGSTTLTAVGGTAGTSSNLNWFEGSCGGTFMEEWFTQPYGLSYTNLNNVNGVLDVTSTSNDPKINMSGLGSYDPSVYKYINVRYRVVSGTAGNTEIFFYNTAHGGAVGGESASGALISDGSWHILNIDMTSDPDYLTGGNITGWRYDWCTASGVRMEIDYIALSSSQAVGQGSSIVVTPTSTTSYYVLRSGPCNTTSCASTTVNVDNSNPSYVGYSNISGYQYQESSTVYWVKGGNNFSIDISHSDNNRVWRQYFGFNKDDCSPNGCGGAPFEIKSYNTDNSFSDWLSDNNYIDIYSANCVDGDGVCTDNDLTRRWISNIKTTCADWDYKLHTYLYDECVKGVGYTDLGVWVKVDNTAPTHDEVTVSESCWSTDGTNTYTITVKSTEPRSGFGGTYGIMALINYNLGEANAGGYFAWHPSSYTHSDDQMACSGGGYVSKASNWGGSRIDLISASTSVVGYQRTVTFVVRPHSDFIELNGGNKISMYTSDNCNNYRGWTLFNPNFTTMKVPNTPTSATTICNGSSANLSTTSVPASGITYYWQTSPTGTSTTIGSGSSITVSPSSTTTYYVRPYSSIGCWGEASLGVTVTVNSLSTAPTSISGTTTICNGDNTTLTAVGGTDGTGASYQWYSGGCGSGSVLGTGSSISVSPTSNTTYYVRRTGTCNTTGCASVTVTVNTLSTAPTSISGTTTICNGGSTSLTAVGGTDGTGASYQWYAGGCGSGSVLGTGVSLNVSPTSTTTYYVRRTGTCNTTTCANVTVTVVPDPTIETQPIGASVCFGDNHTMIVEASGGTPSLSYQWQSSPNNSSWTNISGATTSSYTTGALTNNTYYRVVVSAGGIGCGTATSSSVLVTVYSPVEPGTISADQTICYNSTPSTLVGVSPTGGDGSYTYQWQSSTNCSGVWSDISGAVSANYSPGALTQSTCYRRMVTDNLCGVAYSSPVSVSTDLLLHYTFDDAQIPTSNFVDNPNGTNISNGTPGNYQPGWDATLHSDAITVSDWSSGYNGGVGSPATGYHGRWVFGGIDGATDPCMLFQDENNTYGLGHRWLGISQVLGTPTSLGLSHGDVVTISWYQKTDVSGKGARVGIYHKLISTGSYSFESNISTINVTTVGNWERVSFTTTIGTDWNLAANCNIYVYGHTGSYGKLWVDKVQIEEQNTPTPFVDGSRSSVIVTDYSGNANHGTIQEATAPEWISDGIDGGAYEFDGINDYVKMDNNLIASPTELTISSWFKKNGNGSTYECVLHKGSNATIGASEYWMGVDLNDYLTATIGANTGLGWAAGQTNVVAVVGTWYNLVASWDGSLVKVYINGVYNKQYSLSSYTNVTTPTRIGASSDGANYQFNGIVDDVRIYDRALTATEIEDLYESSSLMIAVQATPTPGVIASNHSICSGGNPLELTNSSSGSGSGTISYRWEKSVSPFSSWSVIAGATGATYDPPAGLTVTTQYRRVTVSTLDGVDCESVPTNTVQVTVNPILPVSVSVGASSNPICFGNSTTFTATPTNGGTPSYQWKLNGANVGTNSSTYVNDELHDGDQIWCVMTSSETCASGNPATSNTITMDIVNPSTIGLINGDYVWSGNVSDAWENSVNWIVFNGSDFDLAITKPGVDDNVFLIDYGTCVVQNPATNIGSTEYCNDIYIYTALTLGNSSLLNVYGDWENYGTFTAGAGKVKFNGSSVQNIIPGGNSFYDIEFANTNLGNYDITLTSNITITHNSVFSQGIVNTGSNKVIYTIGATSGEGNVRSFIDGLVERQGSGSFIVPCGHVINRDIGAGNTTYKIWAPIGINPSSSTTTTVRYYFDNTGLPTWWNAGYNLDATIHHVTDREYWLVNSSTNFANVTLYWKENAHSNGSVCNHSFCSGDNVFVSSDLTVAYWTGSLWRDAGGTATNNHDAGSITSSLSIPFGSKSQTYITFATKDNLNPLPVELSNMTAVCKDKTGIIRWQTLSETNNDYFILEKSNGVDEFYEIARIDGSGNANSINNYQFIDNKLFDGDNYYRLKQVDFDGKVTSFDVINLNCDKEDNLEPVLYAYPNPFNDELNVVIEGIGSQDFVLELFDDLGRLVFTQSFVNDNEDFKTTLNLEGLKPSVYNLRSRTDDHILNLRVIKK